MKRLLNVLFSICFSIFIIMGMVKFTVSFKQLYYFDINYLNIAQTSGFSEDEIRLNYDYLIDYNLGKEEKEFEMPTIKSSPKGKIHFEEVRDIVQNVNKLFIVFLVISVIGIFINIKNREINFLNTTSKALISIPLLLSLPIIINFEDSFITFHKIMFDNDYWIFDPNLDPVITILPEEFFLHAGVMILVLILLSSILIYATYKFLKKAR